MHISEEVVRRPADRNMQSRVSEDWYAENLRLTFLGVPDWTQRPIFAEIASVAPAQINAQPPMLLHQETGNFFEAYLSITQQANRIDVVMSDQPMRNTVDRTLPGYKPLHWIGSFNESLAKFDEITSKTTSLILGATRAAYAITLIRQTGSVREAVGLLRKHLPTVDLDPDHDLDLTFQINRPTRDQKGRFINRLARWDAIQVTTMRVTVGSVPPVPPIPSRPPICAARIYVDVSTDIGNTLPILGSELSELISELRAYAVGIARDGDSK